VPDDFVLIAGHIQLQTYCTTGVLLHSSPDTSLREQIFDIPMTEVETVEKPDGMLNDFGWESVPFVHF